MDLSKLSNLAALKNGAIEHVLFLDISKVKADPNQPRKEFSAEGITELAEDIRLHGLIQPIVVKNDPHEPNHYIVIAGERRLRAVQQLKLSEIKAIVNNSFAEEKLGYIQVAENLKRDNLKFYELAEFILSKLRAGQTQAEIGRELGLNKSRVNLYLAWQQAPEFLKAARQHFKSVKSFSEMTKLCAEHEEQVKDYVNALSEADYVTDREVAALKVRLEQKTDDPDQNLDAYEGIDAEHSSESSQNTPQIDFEAMGNTPAHQNEENVILSEFEPDPEESPTVNPNSSFEDLNADLLQTKPSEAQTGSELQPVIPEDKQDPIILGMVEEQSCTLLYRSIQPNKQEVLVRFEDGRIEPIPPAKFRLEQIVAG